VHPILSLLFSSFPLSFAQRLGFIASMPEDDIHQPHDKLFAIGFGDPINAAGLLRAQLPAELVSQIDWSTLKSESGSFVDPELRKTQSDLLFSATFAGGVTSVL
jgi:hypothetical protein